MSDINPFPTTDESRHAIWDMLVRRDIDAYVARDWDAHFEDFAPELFFGIDAAFSGDPDEGFPIVTWRFGTLAERAQVITYNAPLAIVPIFE